MANKITKDEIAEKDLFDNIIKSADTAINKINELNSSFASLGSELKDSISKIKVDDIKGIKELLTLTKESEKLAREKIKTDKELLNLTNKRQEAEKKLLGITQKIAQQKAESDAKILKSELETMQKIEESNAKMLRSKKETNAKILADKKETQAKIDRLDAESQAKNQTQQLKTQQLQNKIRIENQKEADRIADRQRRDTERQAKEAEKAQKIAKDEADAYKRLVVATRELKNESKSLGAEMLALERAGKKNTDEYRDLAVQYRRVTTEASLADKALKKLDAKVGDNFRNVGNYRNAVNKLTYALGQMGLAFGVFEGLRYFVDAQVALNTLQLSLRSVSKSTEEYAQNFEFVSKVSRQYGQDIITVGDTYKNFIASTNESNVSLARRKELYEQIIKVGSTLALSNSDIEGTLRAVSQIFSKGTVQSEELRQQLGERLPGAFNVMAKAIGVSEVELNKMLKDGVILSEDVMPLFGKELERQAGKDASNKLKTLSGAWNLLKTNIVLTVDKAGEGIGTTQKLASVIKFLGENIGSVIRSLTLLLTSFATYKSLTFVLGGDLKKFSLILKDTVSELFRKKQAVDGLTQSTVVASNSSQRLGAVLKGFGWTAIIAFLSEVALKFYDVASGEKQAREELENYQKALNKGRTKAERFLSDRELEIDKLKVQYKVKLRRATDDVAKSNLKLEASKKISQEKDKMEGDILEKINKATKKRVELENQRLALVKKSQFASALIPLNTREDVSKAIKNKKEVIIQDESFGGALKQFVNIKDITKEYGSATNQVIKDQRAIDIKKFNDLTNSIAGLNKEIITYRSGLNLALDETVDFPDTEGKKGGKVKALTEFKAPLQAIKFEFKDLEEYIVDTNQALRDLEDITNRSKLDEYNRGLDKAVERSTKIAKLFFYKDNSFLKTQQGMSGLSNLFKLPTGLGVNENILPQEIIEDYRKQIRKANSEFERIQIEEGLDQTLLNIAPQIIGSEEYKKIVDNLNEIENLRKKQIDIEAEYKKKKLQEEYDEKIKKDDDFLKKQIADWTALEKYKLEITYQNQLISVDNQSSINAKQKASKKAKIQQEQNKALETINKVYTDWETQNDIIQNSNKIKMRRELAVKIEAIDAEQAYEYGVIEQEKADKTKEVNEQIVESAKEGMNSLKDTAKGVYEYITVILEMMITQSERQLDRLNIQLDKVKEKQGKLTQLAVNGNIQATESLALNEKEQAKIQKNIEKEQRRIEMLKLAQSVYQTYASYASNPDVKNPLTKTISDVTVLSQFVRSLPTFYKGTETDVKTALGNPDIQGRDGYIVRVDGSEKILNPKLSAMTGNMTTYEIAKLAEEHRLGKLIKTGDGAIQIKNSFETNLLIEKLDSLEKTISSKQETNIEVGEILGGVMHIVETTKKQNTTTRNIRRYS